MRLHRRVFLQALAAFAASLPLVDPMGAVAAGPTEPPTRKQLQVDPFRGLADIFSRGMDTLSDKLNRRGYVARVYSTNGWPSAARRIADQYARGHRAIIVLIGQ
jgi:hypothetical protein